MSLNQLINPVKPIDAILNQLTVEAEIDSLSIATGDISASNITCESLRETRNLALKDVSSVEGGVVDVSGFIAGFTVNSLTKYTTTDSYIIREVFLTFSTPLASGQFFSFDFQKEAGEDTLYTSAQLYKGESTITIFGTYTNIVLPNTLRVSFNYLSAQPATVGSAIMNAHLIFSKIV